jgi:SAM-dependent methyltransferase
MTTMTTTPSTTPSPATVAGGATPRADDELVRYHLSELEIARDPSAPGHLLPPIPPGCRAVLDIGCGAGQTLIASALGDDVLACGVDPVREALALGRSLDARLLLGAALGEDLPFKGETFDLVYSRVALPYMHVPRALREIGRVLRPGGTVWLSLHPPAFALRTTLHALRVRKLKGALFPLYTLFNALLLPLLDRQLRWPFGRAPPSPRPRPGGACMPPARRPSPAPCRRPRGRARGGR